MREYTEKEKEKEKKKKGEKISENLENEFQPEEKQKKNDEMENDFIPIDDNPNNTDKLDNEFEPIDDAELKPKSSLRKTQQEIQKAKDDKKIIVLEESGDLAEMITIALGAGCIPKNAESFKVTLNRSEEKQYTKYVYELMEKQYNAINLLDDLKAEVGNLVPKSEKPKGKLSNEKLSVYLGFEERYIRKLKTNIKSKNPDFTFSEDQLNQMLKNLEERFCAEKIQDCVKMLQKYKISNKILEYRHQQWNKYNPNLKFDFFLNLDNTDKGYYFGLLLADGLSEKGANIGLFLEKEDKDVIIRFRKTLGISNEIEHKISKRKKKTGEFSEDFGFRVGCKPMLDDLKKLGFFDFKEGKPLPEGFFSKLDRNVALSILCGFYDGDGEQGTTKIHNTNRLFLEQIRREFNIKNNVQLKRKGGKTIKYSVQCREYIGDLKDRWYLSLGAKVFNEMMESFEDSMERKREYYPVSTHKFAFEDLKDTIKNRNNLENILRMAPVTILINKFDVSFQTFKRLCNEFNVGPLPHSYWKKIENKDWKADFEDKFKTFKKNYLGNEF